MKRKRHQNRHMAIRCAKHPGLPRRDDGHQEASDFSPYISVIEEMDPLDDPGFDDLGVHFPEITGCFEFPVWRRLEEEFAVWNIPTPKFWSAWHLETSRFRAVGFRPLKIGDGVWRVYLTNANYFHCVEIEVGAEL